MIRPYRSEDLKAIEAMHGNPAYVMPQLEHDLMIVRRVMADDDDQPRMAVFGRLLIEAILFVDHTWLTPSERLIALQNLQEDAMAEARRRGLDIVTTQMEGRFAERMQQLGWIRGWGELYYRSL